VRALVVAALEISTGRTTMFTEAAAGVTFAPLRDPRRVVEYTEITPAHVLASAAIPLLFPSRRIGTYYYCDGGVRFAPIAPAIRCGADASVVSPLSNATPPRGGAIAPSSVSAPGVLLGKIMRLLLDPVRYDLQVLEGSICSWATSRRRSTRRARVRPIARAGLTSAI
jgi:NTE family protein